MTFTINRALLAGRISQYGLKLSYLQSRKPELTFTLVLERLYNAKMFYTYIHVQVYGSQAEPLAETLVAGDLIFLERTLGYKADRRTGADTSKDKRPATLAVSCFDVQLIQRAEVSEGATS